MSAEKTKMCHDLGGGNLKLSAVFLVWNSDFYSTALLKLAILQQCSRNRSQSLQDFDLSKKDSKCKAKQGERARIRSD